MMKNLQKLRQIKHHCKEHHYGCDNCIYYDKENDVCIPRDVSYRLCCRPCDWDLRGLEKYD